MPRRGYPTAFKVILIYYGLVVIVAVVLRLYFTFVDKTRDRQGGAAAAAEVLEQAPPEKRQLTGEDYEDITDFNTPGFRYRM
jgi:hypothetical protein